MNDWKTILITSISSIIVATLASSGFWAYLQNKRGKKDVMAKMLLGLAHDRILELGLSYIERGWITSDEYENLNDYLYKPYVALGGNGTAKRVMEAVSRLEIRNPKI